MSNRISKTHGELHRSDRIGWLRAAVLGANDGLISTASLVVGVASAEPNRNGTNRRESGFWGAIAMGVMAAAGRIFGAVV